MKAFKWAVTATILAASSALLAAETNGVSVSHFETLQRFNMRSVSVGDSATTQEMQRTASADMSFDAFGRSFDLQLEPNSRLLAAASRNALPQGIEILRGQLANNADSWARVVVFDGMPRGVIWDGKEMFAIEAPGDSIVQTDVPVIYRLADALVEPGSMSCGSQQYASSGAEFIASLSGELSTAVALAPGAVSEITMAAIGDSSFTIDKGGDDDAVAAIITRLSIVDGYFSEQVGVQIDVQHVETYSDPATDPLTTAVDPGTGETDPSALLNDLGDYRQATPAQNSRGLTHLYTGRDLVGSTAGIAFVGTLCRSNSGAGLSEGDRGSTLDALVAAHEIGHNFGADHDGDPSGPCPDAGNFIMSPSVNQNNEDFSACSIGVMEAVVAAAPANCVTTLPTVDMKIELDAASTTILLGADTTLSYDVTNRGGSPATNVTADFVLPPNLTLDAVTWSVGTCTNGASTISCDLGDVAGLAVETVNIEVTPSTVGADTITATVNADTDARSDNDQETLQLTVDPAVDLVVNTPTAAAVIVNALTTINADLENRSVLDASTVTLSISLSNGLQANTASWSIGTCTVAPQQVDCQAADFAAQSTSTLSVEVRGISNGNKNVTVALASAEAEANPADNSVDGSVRVNNPPDEDDDGGGSTAPLFLSLLLLTSVLRRRWP
jgi:hypothetical protein